MFVAGLVVIRQALNVTNHVDRHCAEVATETINPLAMMESFNMESLFHLHHAIETSRAQKDADMDLFDVHSAFRRRLDAEYMVRGNG